MVGLTQQELGKGWGQAEFETKIMFDANYVVKRLSISDAVDVDDAVY